MVVIISDDVWTALQTVLVFRPHRMHAVQMSHVAWCVCLSVSALDIRLSCAKRLNRSWARLGVDSRSPRECIRRRSRSPTERGTFEGDVCRPMITSVLLIVFVPPRANVPVQRTRKTNAFATRHVGRSWWPSFVHTHSLAYWNIAISSNLTGAEGYLLLRNFFSVAAESRGQRCQLKSYGRLLGSNNPWQEYIFLLETNQNAGLWPNIFKRFRRGCYPRTPAEGGLPLPHLPPSQPMLFDLQYFNASPLLLF